MKKQILIGIAAAVVFVISVELGMFAKQVAIDKTDKEAEVESSITEEETATQQETEEETTTQKETEEETTTQKETEKMVTNKNGISELSVKGTTLVDDDGNTVVLRGVSTHGLAWYPDYVNYYSFKTMKEEWNINIVRLAMYTDESGGYCVTDDAGRDKLKQLISDGVEYATKLDMYIIIDWHVLSDSNPNTHKEEAKKFFDEMSEKYSSYSNVIYEICNEPNGSTTWQDVKEYANEVIPVIRNNDKNAVIIVGTPTWSQDVDRVVADPLEGYDNIMYALHFYAATHKDDLRSKMENAINAGLPVFVSEYGICDASGNGQIDEASANEWLKLMDTYNVSSCIWNLSNKNESSALFNVGCTKTSNWSQDDLSDEGKWFVNIMKNRD